MQMFKGKVPGNIIPDDPTEEELFNMQSKITGMVGRSPSAEEKIWGTSRVGAGMNMSEMSSMGGRSIQNILGDSPKNVMSMTKKARPVDMSRFFSMSKVNAKKLPMDVTGYFSMPNINKIGVDIHTKNKKRNEMDMSGYFSMPNTQNMDVHSKIHSMLGGTHTMGQDINTQTKLNAILGGTHTMGQDMNTQAKLNVILGSQRYNTPTINMQQKIDSMTGIDVDVYSRDKFLQKIASVFRGKKEPQLETYGEAEPKVEAAQETTAEPKKKRDFYKFARYVNKNIDEMRAEAGKRKEQGEAREAMADIINKRTRDALEKKLIEGKGMKKGEYETLLAMKGLELNEQGMIQPTKTGKWEKTKEAGKQVLTVLGDVAERGVVNLPQGVAAYSKAAFGDVAQQDFSKMVNVMTGKRTGTGGQTIKTTKIDRKTGKIVVTERPLKRGKEEIVGGVTGGDEYSRNVNMLVPMGGSYRGIATMSDIDVGGRVGEGYARMVPQFQGLGIDKMIAGLRTMNPPQVTQAPQITQQTMPTITSMQQPTVSYETSTYEAPRVGPAGYTQQALKRVVRYRRGPYKKRRIGEMPVAPVMPVLPTMPASPVQQTMSTPTPSYMDMNAMMTSDTADTGADMQPMSEADKAKSIIGF